MKTHAFFLFCLALLISACSTDSKPSEEPTFLAMDDHAGVHIAFVDYLEETDEYAVEIGGLKDKTWDDWYKKGERHCGKIIYEEEYEYRRIQVPQFIAKEWLDIRFLKDIHLYDKNNNDLGKATLVRYEFIETAMTSDFVIVVKLDVSPKKVCYAIGNLGEKLPKIPIDRKARKRLLNSARADAISAGMEEDASIQIGIGKHYFSAFQAGHTSEYKSVCTLFETIDDHTELVMSGEPDEIILNMQPLPLSYKGKPVLLMAGGIRNTCAGGSGLYVFDDKKYAYVRHWGKLGQDCH